jgi:thiamine biosynthesis lipoprotein
LKKTNKIAKNKAPIGTIVGCIALILVVIISMFIPKPQEQYRAVYIDSFDTATQIIGYDDSEELFRQKAEKLNEKLIYYHKLYTIYSNYEDINNIRTINLKAGKEPVKVDKAIIDLIKFSKEMYTKTNGKINIAMGSVLSIWHYYRTVGSSEPENASLPPMEELQEAAKHTDINKIIIDEEASTVYLADPEMSLDVGSIGKGYAVQMVAEYARELGYDNMIINVGGNVASIGSKADGTGWKIGIQNPDLNSENSTVKTVQFVDKCLVTSGDYQRYYTVDDKTYCHIIDPATLMPANYFRAVSIIIPDSGMADALSTSLFNMPYEEGLELINSIEGAEAIWVFHDGSIKYSDNFSQYLVD